MSLFSRIQKDLRKRFHQLDLRGKITAALLAAVLPLGLLVTVTACLAAYYEITEQTLTLLQARAQLERREIELQLTSTLNLAESIAGNSVTAHALNDQHDRETYLIPLLHNQKFSVNGAILTVADEQGHPLASNVALAPDYSRDPHFAAMLQEGVPRASISQRPGQDAELLVALPVHQHHSKETHGGVLLQIPLAKLLEATPATDNRWIKYSNGALLAGNPHRLDTIEVSTALALPGPLENMNLVLVLAQDRTKVLNKINTMLGLFFVFGGLVIVGVIAFSRAGARFITTPLGEIAAAAEKIADSGRPVATLPARRTDEFGRLAAAFNVMVKRLAESYADLEKRVEERTREYQESRLAAEKASDLLRESVNSIAQGFTIYDGNDRLVLCNETYINFYAASRDLIVPGNTFEEIVRRGAERGQYEEAIGNVDEWVSRRVKAHQNANGQMIEQKLGDGRWLMIVEYRTPSGYIVGNRIDITELKNATESLRQREIILCDHTEQLNAIFALSPDGFVSFDANRCVKYASPAFMHLTGLREDEIVGLDETAFSVRLAQNCLAEACFPGVASLRAAQQSGSRIDPIEVTTSTLGGRRTSDQRQNIELIGTVKRVLEVGLRVSQADTVSQILYVRDVTKEVELDRIKNEFLTTAAHELRTPMASIYGFTELMLHQDFDDATRRDFLGTIYRQSEMMIAIINELLDLARIEARRGKDFVIERIDLRAVLRQAVTGFKAPQQRSSPQQPASQDPLWISADRSKLTQAVSNVLSNAYKYSSNNSPVKLELIDDPAQGEKPHRIGIRIVDRGIGMTPEQLDRVFERFYRADTSGSIPGTGLGMNIVREIVELHGGEVSIDSVFGEGTTVTLWLPGEPGNNVDRRTP